MFRRKTDQVYATLQQVQRRISQQTQGGGDGLEHDVTFAPGRAAPAAPADLDVPAQIPHDPPAVPAPVSSPHESPSIDAQMVPASFNKVASAATLPAAWQAAPRRPSLILPWEAASIIFLLWLGSLVGVFFIGRHVGVRAEVVATGPSMQRESRIEPNAAGVTPAAGPRAILVLASVSRASGDAESRFRGDADRLNQFARQNARHGYQPWFGVRKPPAGGLQLVFGEQNGAFGVDRSAFPALAEGLDRAGYKGARWVDVE